MEPVDAYYDIQEGACWGPQSRSEFDMDLLRKKVHVGTRQTVGITSWRSNEDEDLVDYKEDPTSVINNVSKLSVQSKYFTPNETLQSQNTDNFINKMTEILNETPDLKSSSFSTALDISKKEGSTLTSKMNSFSTALDVSDNNSYQEKLSLIDITDSQSDDESLASVLEDIIQKLNVDIKENMDTRNTTINCSSSDKNESEIEFSRYTCTQSKYDDISEVVEDGANMSQCDCEDDDVQSISENVSKLKVFEEELETYKYSTATYKNDSAENINIHKNQSAVFDAHEIFDDNGKHLSVYNISSDFEKETDKHDSKIEEVFYLSSDLSDNDILNDSDNPGDKYLDNSQIETKYIKKEANYPQEIGVVQCSILEISSDESLNNPDDTLNHSYENNEDTEKEVTTQNFPNKSVVDEIIKENELVPQEIILSRKSYNIKENKIILEDPGTGQESPCVMQNKPIIDTSNTIGQSPCSNRPGNNLSVGNLSEMNDSLGIIQLSTKNLEHTLFLNESKLTPSNKANDLLNKYPSYVIKEVEEEFSEESSNHSKFDKSLNTHVSKDVATEAEFEGKSDETTSHPDEVTLNNTNLKHVNLKTAKLYHKSYTPQGGEKVDLDHSYKYKSSSSEDDVDKNKLQCIYEDGHFQHASSSNYLIQEGEVIKSEDNEQREKRIFKNQLQDDYEELYHTEDQYPKSNIEQNHSLSSNDNAAYEFDDTLEEINRALQQGLDYSMSSQQSEDMIRETPAKPISRITYKSQSARKPEKAKIFQSKLPISKYSHIISPISVYRNNPTAQKNTEFKKPICPVTKRMLSPAPGFQKNMFSLNHIQSPVSHYIKNTPTTPLQQNVQTNRNLNKMVFTPVKTEKTVKENIPKLPSVIYKPTSTVLVSKEKNIRLPNKIEKLVPIKTDIIKHQGRLVKNLKQDSVIEKKLLGNDLTIDGSMDATSLSTNDVSILTSRKAFIK